MKKMKKALAVMLAIVITLSCVSVLGYSAKQEYVPTIIIPGLFQCETYSYENGEIAEAYSIASGLDYPGIGPKHAYLNEIGRAEYATINDQEAIDAFFELSRTEGIIPALESSHAVAYGIKLAKQSKAGTKILINLSGRGDKDLDFILKKIGH